MINIPDDRELKGALPVTQVLRLRVEKG